MYQYLRTLGTCPLEYRITDPNHSYCSQPFPNVLDEQVTLSDQEYILDMHNNERHLTYGANMEKMVEFLSFLSLHNLILNTSIVLE